MRQYPRRVYKGKDDSLKVLSEYEEFLASQEGYESHWNPEIVEKRKGTEREILRTYQLEDEELEVSPDPIQINEPQTIKPKELTRGQKAALTRKKNKEKRVKDGDNNG